ncbi:hypothetical protein BGW80DRAFT_1270913 [Lactifluus volemus]|nr:hypothetical protein BGW80DRAFT_1270913 [Lactifluus volemus]
MVQRRINRKRQSNDGFFWKRRFFPLTVLNNSAQKIDVPNPWTTQRPWFDGSASAMRDFANQQSTWSATWPSDDDDLSFRMSPLMPSWIDTFRSIFIDFILRDSIFSAGVISDPLHGSFKSKTSLV